ncbi:MAG: TIGR03084 family protein [Aldersonia sp.]|nr:TIGR03084 family protein [Aldersonia sp.]
MSRLEVVEALAADLTAEAGDLQSILRGIGDEEWATETPAPGWTIHDQVAHLAHFDAITRLAIDDPAAFVTFRDGLPDLQTYVDAVGGRYAAKSGAKMLAWWQQESAALRDSVVAADPDTRVPWFGPAMSLPSKITARIMETWAHGQDVVDAIGAQRPPTDRIRHVVRIGVLSFPNSFRARGRDVPQTEVYVELTAPDRKSVWQWGDPKASNAVRGSALDFCLVVTQRRHRADTDLQTSGLVAAQWMEIAQAFAGPPGQGRRPGQFRDPKPPTPGVAHRSSIRESKRG